MSDTEQIKSDEIGEHGLGEATDRPECTIDEDGNPPLTDPTTTEVDRNRETIPPQPPDLLYRPTRDAREALLRQRVARYGLLNLYS